VIRLIADIALRFPDSPPHGGRITKIIPISPSRNRRIPCTARTVAREFQIAAQGQLPVVCLAPEVTLMDNRSGRWEVRKTFSLGEAAGPAQ
jgi:predicted dienelactone hydrolase